MKKKTKELRTGLAYMQKEKGIWNIVLFIDEEPSGLKKDARCVVSMQFENTAAGDNLFMDAVEPHFGVQEA